MSRPHPLILAATALGIAAGIVLSLRPWGALLVQREEAAAVRADLRRTTKERAALEREAAAARSSVGREEKARAAGFRGKGELDLKLPAEETPDQTPGAAP